MEWIKARLSEQGSLSGIALAALVLIAAHAAGIDATQIADTAAGVLAQVATALGTLAALAKIVVPDNPVVAQITAAQQQAREAEEMARRVAELLRTQPALPFPVPGMDPRA